MPFAVTTHTVSSSTGNQSFSHGLSVEPKALMVLLCGDLTSFASGADMFLGCGYTDGTDEVSWAAGDENAADPTDTMQATSNEDLIYVGDVDGSAYIHANFVSWNSSEFTINNQLGVSYNILVIAFGGAEVSAKVGVTTLRNTVGTQSETGLGFQPTTLFMGGTMVNTGGGDKGIAGHASFAFGWGDQVLGQSGISGYADDNAATSDARREHNSSNMVDHTWSGDTAKRVALDSLDVDGFTIEVVYQTGTFNDRKYPWLALSGVESDAFTEDLSGVGEETELTTNLTASFGTPGLVLFMSMNDVNLSAHNDFNISIGAASASDEQGSVAGATEDNQPAADASRHISDTHALRLITENGATPTIDGSIQLTSFGEDEINYTWDGAGGKRVFGIALRDPSISISVGDIYSLSGSAFGTELPFIRRSGSDTWNLQDASPSLGISGFIRVTASGSFGWSDSPDARLFTFISFSGSGSLMNLSDSASGSTTSRFGRNVLVIGSVQTPVGTEYFSKVGVRHPTRFYRGEVMSWGSVNRSIPAPSGVPRVGNITVNLADTKLFWRQTFSQSSPKNRRITIKLGLEGQSESQFLQVYEGQVTGTSYPPVRAQIQAADITADWFEETIPALITKENFPNKRKGEMFAPIVFGEVIGDNNEGAIPIFECDKVQNRLCVARHPVKSITLYRKRSIDKDAGFDSFSNLDDSFQEVSSIFYDLVEEDMTIDGVDYTFTFAEFNFGGWFMGKNTEWRMDCIGLTDDRTSSGNSEQNFAECIKAVLTEMGGKFNADSSDLDLTSFSDTATALDALSYKCDGAVNEPMTYYDLTSRLVVSANLDFFQNISGQIAISLYQGDNDNRPEFTDLRDIIRESVNQVESVEAINKLRFFYSRNYDVGEENTKTTNQEEWGVEQIFNNDIDQVNTGKETEETFELWFVRDASTADQVIADIASYLDQESFRITFETPGPLNVDRLELGREIGITHYGGLESTGSGFDNEPFKVIGLDFNLDTFKYKVSAIRRVTPASVNQTIEGEWTSNLRAGPWRIANGLFYGIFRDPSDTTRMKAMRTSNFGRTWTEMDSAGFPGLDSTIVTADSEQQSTVIHVLTQNNDGKTEYHRFNTISNSWDRYQLQVTSDQAGVVNGKVSITVLTGGSLCAYFTTSGSGGGGRSSFRLINSSGNTLEGSETAVTTGGRNDRRMTRVLAGSENRAHFFYQARGAFNDEWVATLDSAGSMGTPNRWFSGNLGYYTTGAANANMGFPSVEYSNNQQNATLRIPLKGHFGQAYWAEFASQDNITTYSKYRMFSDGPFLFEGNSNSTTGHGYPAYSICVVDGSVYHIAALFPSLIGLNWEVYKEGIGPLDPPRTGSSCDDLTSEGSPYGSTCGMQHKAGMSTNSATGQTMQCSNAQMYKYGGKLYLMKFTGIDNGDFIAFQHLKVSEDIPQDVSFDVSAFLADLG